MSLPTADHSVAARARRGGFSLMEILVVLAIFALSTAVIMPNLSRSLDQATAHAVFFDFQKQVSDLRREANRTGVDIVVADPSAVTSVRIQAAATGPSEVDGTQTRPQVLTLREPWTYTMAPALEIAEGGVCSVTTANLIHESRVVMTLKTTEGDCRFIRQP